MSGIRWVRTQLHEDPVACPKCGVAWDFATDHIGRVVAIHSVVKCVPKASVLPIRKDVDASVTRICIQCKEPFHPRKFAGKSQTMCSIECSNERQRERHKRNRKAA